MTANFPVSVIIADDEASIRNGLRSAVESMNLNIRVLGTARNGLEAWNLIQDLYAGYYITDIRMPLCDGLNLMKNVRSPSFTLTLSFSADLMTLLTPNQQSAMVPNPIF